MCRSAGTTVRSRRPAARIRRTQWCRRCCTRTRACGAVALGTGSFGFLAMVWVSVHTFSTVGFGNIAPVQSCIGAQVFVLIESFVSLLIVSTIGGYVVKKFLRPLSRVRFSKVILMNSGRRRVSIAAEDDKDTHAEGDKANRPGQPSVSPAPATSSE